MQFSEFFKEVAARREPKSVEWGNTTRTLLGLKLWVRHEMPLWWAWANFILSSLLLWLLGHIKFEGGWSLFLRDLFAVVLMLTLMVNYLVAIYASLMRLGDVIGRVAGYLFGKLAAVISTRFHFLWDPIAKRFEQPIARLSTQWNAVTHWLLETGQGQKALVLSILAVITLLVACFPSFFWGILTDFWEHDKWILKPALIFIGCLYGLLFALVLILSGIRHLRKK